MMKFFKKTVLLLLVLAMAFCGCAKAEEETPIASPTVEATAEPTPEPTPEPTVKVPFEPFVIELEDDMDHKQDVDFDGKEDRITCTQDDDFDVNVTLEMTARGTISHDVPYIMPYGELIGIDLGDGEVSFVFSLYTGMQGGAGSRTAAIYTWDGSSYTKTLEEMPHPSYTGSIADDAKTVSVETENGVGFSGVIDNTFEGLANTAVMADPVSYVSYALHEDHYDLISSHYLYSEYTHMAGVATAYTRYCLISGEPVLEEEWIEFWE